MSYTGFAKARIISPITVMEVKRMKINGKSFIVS